MYEFLSKNIDEILKELFIHAYLSILPTLAAIIIAIPISVLVARLLRAKDIMENLSDIFKTLPNICALALMIYILGVGFLSVAALVFIVSVFIVSRQTIIGIKMVTKEKIDSIKKLGLSRWQMLSLIRIPICLPFIVDGIRVSCVRAISIVTLAAFFGSGGLGVFIYRGIAMDDYSSIAIGSLVIVVFGLLLNYLLVGVSNLLTANGLKNTRKEELHEKGEKGS